MVIKEFIIKSCDGHINFGENDENNENSNNMIKRLTFYQIITNFVTIINFNKTQNTSI